MTTKHLQDAIGSIDDSFIEEAASAVVLQPKTWIPAAAVAACALLTVALLPWGNIFSSGSPLATGPQHSDNSVGVLQNDDTSSFEDTNGKETDTIAEDTSESSQDSSEDTSYNRLPMDTQSLGSMYGQDGDENLNPSVTLPQMSDDTETNNSTEPGGEIADKPDGEKTDPYEEETTGPLVPNDPVIPDPGITLPEQPVILSHPSYPLHSQYPSTDSLLLEWRNEKDERINDYTSGIGNTDSFISCVLSEFFSTEENKNRVFSPVNAYMTLGMLTETAGGNSRTQLLNLFGENDILSLRSSANSLWNSCYRDDGIVTAVLANSMWLDNSYVPNTAVTDTIAENYYASSFSGNMGDEEYDALMRSWISEQTKGFLDDSLTNSALDPNSMMTLMSTVYYKAEWAEKFDSDTTRNMTFHAPGEDVTAQFMYKDFVGLRYDGANFKSTYLELREGGEMWFILPDKDVSLQSLFSDTEALGFITGKTQKTLSYGDHSEYMWLFLPKFDISSRIDLKNSLKNIGVTDIFNHRAADFSNLTSSKVFVNDISQSARISIDENGCEAAAVSGGIYPDGPSFGGEQSLVFVLDRPFIFVITSDNGLPLFVGTVNRPN